MANNARCAACGRALNRGATSAHTGAATCLVCQVAQALAGWRPSPAPPKRYTQGVCACGCGRVGALIGRGMVSLCYQRAYHARRASK